MQKQKQLLKKIINKTTKHIFILLFFLFCFQQIVFCKRHSLNFIDESQRNILLSKFGYGINGTLDFSFSNFIIPKAVLEKTEIGNQQDKLGSIGFTFSKGKTMPEEIRTKPHICQLEQQDQGFDVIFFVFNFPTKSLIIIRSGLIKDIKLCSSTENNELNLKKKLIKNHSTIFSCIYSEEGETHNSSTSTQAQIGGFFQNLLGVSNKNVKTAYLDYIPLTQKNEQYSAEVGIRFNSHQIGYYYLYYHNCFNYREHGYSDRVAVDFTTNIVERNIGSYLSIGDVPKPPIYVYMAFLFALATILWANLLCKSDSKNIFKVHRLMLLLVFLKTLSLLFHGINYYFVSIQGHQQQLWAILYYLTHLLKGALLFGTIILIGTGYTFFKNFLADRDRRLFMFILPIQILDNVALVIVEESDLGDQRYIFWMEIFVFLDLVCCMAVILPIIWSIRHLEEGARTDGKMAFNLEKLRLFRQFYVIIIAYIYVTRVVKFLIEFSLPQEYRWMCELIVEISTLFFFCLVGSKFRPIKSNPYLRLTQDDSQIDAESGIALTTNGLFEKITRIRQISVQDENNDSAQTDDDNDDDDTLLPKTGRDMALLTL